MVYVYNGILCSLKKKGISDTCYNMDGPWKCCTCEINHTEKDKYWMIHLYEVLRAVKFIKTENGVVVARGWGEGGMGS